MKNDLEQSQFEEGPKSAYYSPVGEHASGFSPTPPQPGGRVAGHTLDDLGTDLDCKNL